MLGVGSNKDGKLGLDKGIVTTSKLEQLSFPKKTRIIQISCGWGHSLALDNVGTVFSWGFGKTGALGNRNYSNSNIPIKVNMAGKRIISISCGSQHSGFLTDNGEVFMCGANHNGQLGIGSKESKAEPKKVRGIDCSVKQIALGVTHTLLLAKSGQVYATGGNNFGQLGVGHKQAIDIPQKIQELENVNINKVSCGQHSAALSDTGKFYLWGTGTFGVYLTPHQVTFSGMDQAIEDFCVAGSFGLALDYSHQLWSWGTNTSGELATGDYKPKSAPSPIESICNKNIASIYCGSAYVFALSEPLSNTGKNKSKDSYLNKSPKSNICKKEFASDLSSIQKNEYDEESSLDRDNKNSKKTIEEMKKEIENLKREVKAQTDVAKYAEIDKKKTIKMIDELKNGVEQEAQLNLKAQLSLDDRDIELKAVRTEAELAKQNFALLKTDYERLIEKLEKKEQSYIELIQTFESMQTELHESQRINSVLESKIEGFEKENTEKDEE